ncbi:MAG: hypothetical protein QM730_17000 [Anaerolineales bacterium]
MDATFETKEHYILITASGKATLVDASRILMEFIKTYRNVSTHNILCDIRMLTGADVEDGMMPRYRYASLIAELLSKHYRLVLLMTDRQIDKQRFGENFIFSRGIRVKATTDWKEALHWLGVESTIEQTE